MNEVRDNLLDLLPLSHVKIPNDIEGKLRQHPQHILLHMLNLIFGNILLNLEAVIYLQSKDHNLRRRVVDDLH